MVRTSMAAPHVAGLRYALYPEPGMRAQKFQG